MCATNTLKEINDILRIKYLEFEVHCTNENRDMSRFPEWSQKPYDAA